jgi:hypothetical protein
MWFSSPCVSLDCVSPFLRFDVEALKRRKDSKLPYIGVHFFLYILKTTTQDINPMPISYSIN